MTPFYVIGHKNPDTDAICSAIGYAELLRVNGEQPHALAARCGELSQRTRWVLERAALDAPLLLTDVRTDASMICKRDIITVKATDTFLVAYQRMIAQEIRCVPVVDELGDLCGMLRYIDLLKLLLPSDTKGLSVRSVYVSLANLATTLEAESVGAKLPDSSMEEDLILLVGASSQTTVDRRLKKAKDEGNVNRFLVICGDRPIVQRYAIDNGARALLVTGGNKVSKDIVDYALEKGVVLLLCKTDTASASTLIRCSRTVQHVMDKDVVTIGENEPVSRLRKRLSVSHQDLFPVMDVSENKMLGVFSKSDLVDPPRIRLALVDHNEYAQAVTGVEEADVVEVIDHHRLSGNLVSREPIRYLNEPVGSTCTLVARKYGYLDLKPTPSVALCLCAGIVSDTLCLTSPTTSQLDHKMLEWLSEIAGVNPQEFTEEFFAVGSLIANGSPSEIINTDRKEFVEQSYLVSISQVEERDLLGFEARQDELEAELLALYQSKSYDLVLLAVTDVALHQSVILAIGKEAILMNLPFVRKSPNLFFAAGVVSRKRQIFPAVCEAIANAQ